MIIDCKDCENWIYSAELTTALSKPAAPAVPPPTRPGTTAPPQTPVVVVRLGTCRSHSPGPGHVPSPKERRVYYPITAETGDGCAGGTSIE
jgi:hypothetical protein